MLNNIGSNFSNIGKKTKLGIVTLATIFSLSGCGGESSSGNSGDNSGGGTPTPTVPGKLIGNSQAGTVVGADISVETSNGLVLYTTTTNNDGQYEIVETELEQILENNGLNKNTDLFVFSKGGTDVDSNDNGNRDDDIDKTINGEMVSILAFNEINGSYITPLSTLIFNIIKNESNNFSDLKNSYGELKAIKLKNIIEETLLKVGAIDINGDGKVDKEDLIRYDMVLNESNLESTIRASGFIDNIHSGNIQDQKTINTVKSIINNLAVTKTSYNFSGELNLGDFKTKGYASPELKAERDSLEGKLQTLRTDFSNKSIELTNLETTQTELNRNISTNNSSLSSQNNNLAKLANFENKVGKINFPSDSDNSVKTKINNVPNISNIIVTTPKSLRSRGLRAVSTSNTEIISTINLESRNELLREQIKAINEQIKQIDKDIKKKEEDIKDKKNEIKKEETKLKEKKDKVDEIERKLSDFKRDNKTEISEYKQAVRNYDSGLKELENLGRIKNLFLDVGYITKRNGPTNAIRTVKERQSQIKLPKSSSYTLDSTTKKYSDLWYFKEDVMDLFGKKIEAEISYSYNSDYPAKIRFVSSYTNTTGWINNIKNEAHKKALIKYVGARKEKSLLISKLEDLEEYEDLIDIYDFFLGLLLEIELELDGTLKEYNNLKKSIQPAIDNLERLKRDLENKKSGLQSDKNTKENLEDKKKKLIDQLNGLKVQINEFNYKQPLVKANIVTLEDEKIYLSGKKIENDGLIVDLNNDKTLIEIQIGKKQSELNGVNNEIDSNSDMKSSLTATVNMYGKDFRITMNSDKVGGESVGELEQKLKKHIENNTKGENINTITGGNSFSYTLYWPNGIGTFPAYIWGKNKIFGVESTTKVYKRDSQENINDFIQSVELALNYSVLSDSGVKHNLSDDKTTPLSTFKYEEKIKYYHTDSNDKFPAKIGIKIHIGNQSFYRYSNTLAYNKDEFKLIINNLLENIESDSAAVSDTLEEPQKVHHYRYLIIEINNKYVPIWQLLENSPWHAGLGENTEYEAINKVKVHLEKLYIKYNTKEEKVTEADNEIELPDSSNLGDFENIKFEYEKLESEYSSYCLGQNLDNTVIIPKPETGSVIPGPTEFQECIMDQQLSGRLDNKKIDLYSVLNKTIEFHIKSVIGTYNTGKGFGTGYASAIHDQAEFIRDLPDKSIKEGLSNMLSFAQKIGAYWPAKIHYEFTKDAETLQIIKDIEKEFNFGPEIKEIEDSLKQIEWDYIEDKEYWMGYLGGYITENMVVGYGVGKTVKGINKAAMVKIKVLIQSCIIAGRIGKALNTPLKLNKKGFINVGAILWTGKNVEKLVNNNTSINSLGNRIETTIGNLGFESQIDIDDKILHIYKSYKGDLKDIPMSDIILEQIRYAGKKSSDIKRIILDNVVNTDIIKILKDNPFTKVENNWGNIGGLDKMTIKLSEKLGKDIDIVKVFKSREDLNNYIKYDIVIIFE